MKLGAGNGVKQDREVLPFLQPVPVSARQAKQLHQPGLQKEWNEPLCSILTTGSSALQWCFQRQEAFQSITGERTHANWLQSQLRVGVSSERLWDPVEAETQQNPGFMTTLERMLWRWLHGELRRRNLRSQLRKKDVEGTAFRIGAGEERKGRLTMC